MCIPLPWTRLRVLSVLIMLAGVVVVATPPLSVVDVRVVVAWMLVFTNAFHVAFAWPFRSAPAVHALHLRIELAIASDVSVVVEP